MPRIITSHEKLSVIDDWLNGESRIDIAKKHKIGNGTVYNIIQEWSNGISAQLADRLREIAIKLKQNRLTVSGCAKGLRMLIMLKKYEIEDDENEEKVTYFLKELYTKCQEVGLTPQKVFDYIGDILKFSSEISISQLPQFMKKKIQEKEELEGTMQELSIKIDELTKIHDEKEHELQRLLKFKEIKTKDYNIFMKAQFQLKQHGLDMENIHLFVNSVIGMSKENNDYIKVLGKIADYENLEKNTKYFNEQVKHKKDELAKLEEGINIKKKDLSYFEVKLENINELEMRGFGIIELRTLINILNEIGIEKNQNFDVTRKKFFDDVKNYVEVIGSRIEIDRLKNELKNLEIKTLKEKEKYIAYPTVIEAILRLAGSEINEQDIIKIDKILSMTNYYPNNDKPLYKETLIDDLQKYGNLKLAIKNLQETEKDLKLKKRIRYKQMKKREIDTIKK